MTPGSGQAGGTVAALRAEAEALRPPSAAPGRRAAIALLGLAVSAVFVWLATREVSLARVADGLAGADYGWLVPTIALTYLTGWLRALRWQRLFMRRGSVTVADSFAAVNVGLMFNNVLPARAGEVPRVLAVRRASGLPAVEIGMTVVVERLLDVFALALVGAALWPLFPDRTWIDLLGVLCAGIVLGSVAVVAAVLVLRRRFPDFLFKLLRRLPLVSDQRAQSVRLAVGAGSAILLDRRRLTTAVALSFAVWGTAAAAGWALFPAFDLELGGAAPWLLLVANSFALTIPSTPGSVGVYEASVQASLVAFGASASTGLSYALVLHAVNFFPLILTGVVCAWYLGRRPPHPSLERRPDGERSPAPAAAVRGGR